MACGPITSWQIDGETVADFIFWGSKITADGDCSHEIKRQPSEWEKIIANETSDKGLIPKYTMRSYNSMPEKQTTQSKSGKKT